MFGDGLINCFLYHHRHHHHHFEKFFKLKLITFFKQKSYELEALTFRLRALEESAKLVTSKSNEIIVEENDLKQLDNCDQR